MFIRRTIGATRVRVVEPIPVTLKAGEVLVEKDLYLPLWNWANDIRFTLYASPNTSFNKSLTNFQQSSEEQFDNVLVIENAKSTVASANKTEVIFNRKLVLKKIASRQIKKCFK